MRASAKTLKLVVNKIDFSISFDSGTKVGTPPPVVVALVLHRDVLNGTVSHGRVAGRCHSSAQFPSSGSPIDTFTHSAHE